MLANLDGTTGSSPGPYGATAGSNGQFGGSNADGAMYGGGGGGPVGQTTSSGMGAGHFDGAFGNPEDHERVELGVGGDLSAPKDPGRRERGRSRRKHRAEKMAHASNREEKEFMDVTTKKNLVNVQTKLDRAMGELGRESWPVFLKNRQTRGMDKLFPQGMPAGGAMTLDDGRIPSKEMLGHLSSRAGSKDRRSSFGSQAAEASANRLTNVLHGKGQVGQMGQMLVSLNTEIVIQATMQAQHPLVAGNLRELLKIDDRLDPKKVAEAKYRQISDAEAIAIREENERRYEELQQEAERRRLKEEENDMTPSPINRDGTPRMRHVRSYRCATAKEVNDMRGI